MYDLVIREVTLYDGSGVPPVTADVAIEGIRTVFVNGARAVDGGEATQSRTGWVLRRA